MRPYTSRKYSWKGHDATVRNCGFSINCMHVLLRPCLRPEFRQRINGGRQMEKTSRARVVPVSEWVSPCRFWTTAVSAVTVEDVASIRNIFSLINNKRIRKDCQGPNSTATDMDRETTHACLGTKPFCEDLLWKSIVNAGSISLLYIESPSFTEAPSREPVWVSACQ